MQCKSVLTRIDARRTGELDDAVVQELDEHLGRCESCNESVTDIEQLASAAKSLMTKPVRSCLDKCKSEMGDRYDLVISGNDRAWVAYGDRGIRMISLASGSSDEFEKKYYAKFGRDLQQAPIPKEYREQVLAALSGRPPRNPSVDISELTRFEQNVLRTICRIPRGSVRPYSWVARQIRRPRAVRAVGNALANNPVPLLMPCHRVVPAAGGIGNYGYGTARKRAILAREGAPVEELERRRAG